MKPNICSCIRLFGSLLTIAVLIPSLAHAGLVDPGATVQAFYFNGGFGVSEGEIPVGASTTDPAPLTSPVNYQEGAASGSTIHVGDTQIVITNLFSGAAFCSNLLAGTACADVIDGFDFKFTGENILGVTLNASSAADFLPVTGTFQGNTHLGLQLLSNNEIQVDVTGDLALVNDQLVLDLSFADTSPSLTPLPATLPLFAGGLGMMGWIGSRRWRKLKQSDDNRISK